MDYELHLAGLEIEITRDCNLNCPHCMRYNDTEIYRKEVHEQFPALYPDDIENISNMSEEQSYLCCQIQATLLQRMRSSTPIDTSCWCTCPKKESQN